MFLLKQLKKVKIAKVAQIIQAIFGDKTSEERIDYYDTDWNKLDLHQKAFDNHLIVDLGIFGSIQKNNYLPFKQKLLYSDVLNSLFILPRFYIVFYYDKLLK